MEGKNNKRVLIVEDDKLLALVEERLITKLGYDVVGKAPSGEEGIRMHAELNPDIMIVDISLRGGMDGVEMVERLRTYSSVPVIFLSGNMDRFNYERAKKTGLISFLIKPVSKDELQNPLRIAASKSDATRPPKVKIRAQMINQQT